MVIEFDLGLICGRCDPFWRVLEGRLTSNL